jgi:hypothetical protein
MPIGEPWLQGYSAGANKTSSAGKDYNQNRDCSRTKESAIFQQALYKTREAEAAVRKAISPTASFNAIICQATDISVDLHIDA